MPYVPWLLVIVLYASYGINFVFLKRLAITGDPMLMVMWRLGIAGLAFLAWFFATDGKPKPFGWKDVFWFSQFFFFGIIGAFFLTAWSAQYISATKICFYFNLAPFMTTFLAFFAYNKVINRYRLIAGVIAFAGFAPHLYYLARHSVTEASFSSLPILPDLVMILAVIGFAYGWIALDKLKKFGHADSFVNGLGMLCGSIALCISAIWYIPLQEIPTSISFWTDMIGLVLTGNLIFYALYGLLLQSFNPTTLSFMGLMAPLFTAGFSWLMLNQPVTLQFFITLLIVTLSLYIFARN